MPDTAQGENYPTAVLIPVSHAAGWNGAYVRLCLCDLRPPLAGHFCSTQTHARTHSHTGSFSGRLVCVRDHANGQLRGMRILGHIKPTACGGLSAVGYTATSTG